MENTANAKRTGPHADIVLMGSSRVGKTAILHRMLNVVSSPVIKDRKYRPTIEDSFVREFIVNDLCCRLRLIDTAGSYEFPEMQRLWLRKGDAFIFVCSRNDPVSMSKIKQLFQQMLDERGIGNMGKVDRLKIPVITVVINKCDLPMAEWLITDPRVEQFIANELNLPYSALVYTSAITGFGIEQIFRSIWAQNQMTSEEPNEGRRPIVFDRISPTHRRPSVGRRRASAFAVLEDHQPTTRRQSSNVINNNPFDQARPYGKIIGDMHVHRTSIQLPQSKIDASNSESGTRASKIKRLIKAMTRTHLESCSPERNYCSGSSAGRRRTRTDSLGSVTAIDMNCQVS